MAKLVYSMIESPDGHAADAAGKFDWAEPDASTHAFLNVRPRVAAVPDEAGG